MPFKKPEPASFKVVVCGEIIGGLALLQHMKKYGCCSKNEHPSGILDYVKVEVPLQKTHVSLEFHVALLKDVASAPISLYFRGVDVILLVSQDGHDLPEITGVIGWDETKIFVSMNSRISEKKSVIREVKRKGYDAFVIYDLLSGKSLENLIEVIKRCLVLSGKPPLFSLKQEMERIDVRSDKANVHNTTLCYERNSIG